VGEAWRRAGSACAVGFGERFLARCEGEARGKHLFSGAVGSARRTACGTRRRAERRHAGGGGRFTGERKK
jgi:hypothetical protein